MKTTENNKLIADFMGFHEIMLDEESKYDIGDIYEILGIDITAMGTIEEDQLEFRTSWEWLMPVVEKIESLGFEFFIVENRSKVKYNTDHSIDVLCYLEGGSKIDITYQTVIEFIKWYNKQGGKDE